MLAGFLRSLAGIEGRILLEVADGQALRARDRSAIGHELTRNEFEQRRFARAVRADEAHAAIVVDLPIDFGQDVAREQIEFEVVQVDGKHVEYPLSTSLRASRARSRDAKQSQ